MGNILSVVVAYEEDFYKTVQSDIWIVLQLYMLIIKNPHRFITCYNFIEVLP